MSQHEALRLAAERPKRRGILAGLSNLLPEGSATSAPGLTVVPTTEQLVLAEPPPRQESQRVPLPTDTLRPLPLRTDHSIFIF